MTGYRLRPSAEEDMDAIWDYTRRTRSAAHADRYIDDLFDAFERLVQTPQLGQKAVGVSDGYRRLRVNHHLIFYRGGGDRQHRGRSHHSRASRPCRQAGRMTSMPAKILISACLLGRPVRYDGKGKPLHDPLIERWKAEGRLVGYCPEQAGGLPTPRPPAEIEGGKNGEDVLAGRARVLEVTGGDVTEEFLAGGRKAVAFAREQGCEIALLIDGSPSCGSSFIYDGSFSGTRHPGFGVTAALMRQAGIEVFSDRDLDKLEAHLESIR